MTSVQVAKLYSQKPEEVYAVQWDGTDEHARQIVQWMIQLGGMARYINQEDDYKQIEFLDAKNKVRSATKWSTIVYHPEKSVPASPVFSVDWAGRFNSEYVEGRLVRE